MDGTVELDFMFIILFQVSSVIVDFWPDLDLDSLVFSRDETWFKIWGWSIMYPCIQAVAACCVATGYTAMQLFSCQSNN